MRWVSERPTGKWATVRVRSGFLWVPKKIGDETRWLERSMWVEEYDDEDDVHGPGPQWVAVEWLDDDRYTITEAGKAYLEGKK